MATLKLSTTWQDKQKSKRLEIRCTENLKKVVTALAVTVKFGHGYHKTEAEIVREAIIEYGIKHKVITPDHRQYI